MYRAIMTMDVIDLMLLVVSVLGLIQTGTALPRHMLFEDVIPRSRSSTRTVVNTKQFSWPYGRMPYVIDDGYSEIEKTIIQDSIADLMSQTNIKLIPRTTEEDYALIRNVSGRGCTSYIGRIGGAQIVSLEGGCVDKLVIFHEILHAYGMNHEHVRPDRDEYIEVKYDMISPGWRQWYEIDRDEAYRSTLDLPYDFNSVMHYASGWTPEQDGEWEIRPRQKYVESLGLETVGLNYKTGLSPLDIQRANLLYASYVQRSRAEEPVVVQVSLVAFTENLVTAKGREGCATLVRNSPQQRCRIFFRETHKVVGVPQNRSSDPAATYGPYDSWGPIFQFMKAKRNVITHVGDAIELTVSLYYAYYEGNIGASQFGQTPLMEEERKTTFTYSYRVSGNQTKPVIKSQKFKVISILAVSFEELKQD